MTINELIKQLSSLDGNKLVTFTHVEKPYNNVTLYSIDFIRETYNRVELIFEDWEDRVLFYKDNEEDD